MKPHEIDGVAVTVGPGLVGSLLVGVSYAKAMAFALGKPLVGVNHIEGHVYSVAFGNPPVEYPALALIVSGGHSNLFLVPEPGKYKVLARTRDDEMRCARLEFTGRLLVIGRRRCWGGLIHPRRRRRRRARVAHDTASQSHSR